MSPGEEGRVSDLQQHPAEADRHPQPHRRVLLLSPRGAVCAAKRVSFSLTHSLHVPQLTTAVGVILSDVCVCPSSCRYETPGSALNCGIMLRECIRHEPLAKLVLHSEHFQDFFSYVELETFDIASDAFATFKVRLHKIWKHLWVLEKPCIKPILIRLGWVWDDMLIFTLLLYLSMPICLRVDKMNRSEIIRCSRWYAIYNVCFCVN